MDGKIAHRTGEITDEEWLTVNKTNRDMVQDYLDNQSDLSIQTKPAYKSGLRIFFKWIKDNLNDKDFTQIKKKEFQKYLNWLTNRGMSDSAIKFKKSCVSAFCNYVMMMYEEEIPTFRNFTVGLKVVQTGYVHEKAPLTPDEYVALCQELEKREEWQKLAYLVFSYSTGCRRAEARQLLKEVIDYPAKEKKIKIIDEDGREVQAISRQYHTHTIRCKGKSIQGKPRKLKFGEDAMHWLKNVVMMIVRTCLLSRRKMDLKLDRLEKVSLMIGAKVYLLKLLGVEFIRIFSESQELQISLYTNTNQQKLHRNYLGITMYRQPRITIS